MYVDIAIVAFCNNRANGAVPAFRDHQPLPPSFEAKLDGLPGFVADIEVSAKNITVL